MAGSVSDYFDVGQAIGQGFARRRFNKQIAEHERAYGVSGDGAIDDEAKRNEFEQGVSEIARRTGLTRRGLEDDADYLKRYRDQQTLIARRRMAEQAAAGNVADAARGYGREQIEAGNFVAGLDGFQMGGNVDAFNANPDNPEGRARAMAKVAGQTGDTKGVDALEGKAIEYTQQRAAQLRNRIDQGLTNVDEIVAEGNGLLGVPGMAWSGFKLRETADGQIQFMARDGETPLGAPMGMDEVGKLISQFTTDAKSMHDAFRSAEAEQAQGETKYRREVDMKLLEGRIKAITEAFGGDGAVSAQAQKVAMTAKDAEAAGFKFSGAPIEREGELVQQATYNDRPVMVIYPDPAAGGTGRPRIIDTASNTEVRFDGESGSTIMAAVSASSQMARNSVELGKETLLFQLQALDAVQGNKTGSLRGGLQRDRKGLSGMAGDDVYAQAKQRIFGLEAPKGEAGRTAKNPNSTATGRGQFVEGTWLEQVSKVAPELTQGKTREQILALRTDDALMAKVTDNYMRENGAALEKNGWPVNADTLYLAHHFGAGGANTFLEALSTNSSARFEDVFPAKVVAANPTYKGMSIMELANSFDERAAAMAGGPAPKVEAKATGGLETKPKTETAAAKVPPKVPGERDLRRAAGEASGAATAVRSAQAALAAFEQKYVGGLRSRGGVKSETISDPAIREAHRRLVADVEKARKSAEAASGAADRTVASRNLAGAQKRAQELYDEARKAGRSGTQ